MTPHHVIPQSRGDKSADELNNLLTLCLQCHNAVHVGFLDIEVLAVLATDVLVRFVRKKGWKPT